MDNLTGGTPTENKPHTGYIDYMDIKAASEASEQIRGRVRHMLLDYRVWRQKHDGMIARSAQLNAVDALMRRQTAEMFALYRSVNSDYLGLQRRCMAQYAAANDYGRPAGRPGANQAGT